MSAVDLFSRSDALYTEQQSKILTILPFITGPMSVIGSGIIIYVILSDRKRKLQRVYHRLLLGYSIIDFMTSANLALSALVVPKGTDLVWGAVGNVATCEASGFINQFLQSQGLYNSFMCLYMMLVVRYDVKEKFIKKWVEPFLHSWAFLGPIIFGGLLLKQNLYNPAIVVVGWCFIAGAPGDCVRYPDQVECTRGANYGIWLMLLNFPYFLYMTIVILSSIGTYLRVRQLDMRMSSWTFGSSTTINSSTRRASVSKKTEDTFRQAILYIGSFMFTYGFYAVNTMFGPADYTSAARNFYFPMTLLTKLFLPLQGAWNCVIFILPRYSALRRRNPDASFSALMNRIIFHSHQSAKHFTLQQRQQQQQQQQQENDHSNNGDGSRSDVVDEPGQDDFQPAVDSSDGTQSSCGEDDETNVEQGRGMIPTDQDSSFLEMGEGGCLAENDDINDNSGREPSFEQPVLDGPPSPSPSSNGQTTEAKNSWIALKSESMSAKRGPRSDVEGSIDGASVDDNAAINNFVQRTGQSQRNVQQASGVSVDLDGDHPQRHRRHRRSVALFRSLIGLRDSGRRSSVRYESGTARHPSPARQSIAVMEQTSPTADTENEPVNAGRNRRSMVFVEEVILGGDL